MFMKTFEELHCAWMDGQLAPAEAAAFEARLREEGLNPEEERKGVLQLRTLLREHGKAPAMENPEFFNHQVLSEIRRGSESATKPARIHGVFGWSLGRMAWAGAGLVAGALLLFRFAVPQPVQETTGSAYLAQILDAKGGEGISATALHDEKQDVTVLWLDGLEYIPDDAVL